MQSRDTLHLHVAIQWQIIIILHFDLLGECQHFLTTWPKQCLSSFSHSDLHQKLAQVKLLGEVNTWTRTVSPGDTQHALHCVTDGKPQSCWHASSHEWNILSIDFQNYGGKKPPNNIIIFFSSRYCVKWHKRCE